MQEMARARGKTIRTAATEELRRAIALIERRPSRRDTE
jgi:hypothetical protein